MKLLVDHYTEIGLPKDRWHIGAEHPSLEQFAVEWLKLNERSRVLEIGFQAGGFAVPVIIEMHHCKEFKYVGIDSLAYSNAVDGGMIGKYLAAQGIPEVYEFRHGDAATQLHELAGQSFDLILIDHLKALYPRELETVLRQRTCAPGGIILLHDVLGRARWAWRYCRILAHLYGCTTEISSKVPEGLAIVHVPKEYMSRTAYRWLAKVIAFCAPHMANFQTWFNYHRRRLA